MSWLYILYTSPMAEVDGDTIKFILDDNGGYNGRVTPQERDQYKGRHSLWRYETMERMSPETKKMFGCSQSGFHGFTEVEITKPSRKYIHV